MLEGKSRLRNPIVADVFHKMAIIEKWGTGIRRMSALGQKSGVAIPIVQPSGSTVSVSFRRPVKGNGMDTNGEGHGKEMGKEKSKEKILSMLSGNPHITTSELSAATGLSISGVGKHLRALKTEGRIKRIGPDKGGYWKVDAVP